MDKFAPSFAEFHTIRGVTAAEAVESAELPFVFVAKTLNV
jgi:hypothetical protein